MIFEAKMDKNEIIIEDDYCSWNGIRAIFFQCQHTERRWGEDYRCGGDSMYLVSYKTIYGTQITKHLCEVHTKEIIRQAKEKGYTIIDNSKVLTK
jgi:hypothetical protein